MSPDPHEVSRPRIEVGALRPKLPVWLDRLIEEFPAPIATVLKLSFPDADKVGKIAGKSNRRKALLPELPD
jgi:hypothetical protein